MAVQVNTLSEIFDFSQMNDKENEEFCDRMITKKSCTSNETSRNI